MSALPYVDHRSDPSSWARALSVSREAIEIYLGSEVIDLHVDAFIWTRVAGYDLTKRHGAGLFGARFYSHTDLPRVREAQIGGAIWAITTNPFRSSAARAETFAENLARLSSILKSCPDDVALVKTAAEYRAARAAGKHGAFLGVQGGNALDRDRDALELLDDRLVQVTLVHLSTSSLGQTSSPLSTETLWAGLPRRGRDEGGLSRAGLEYLRRLNEKKIFVDLAHIDRKGFFDAVAHHDQSQPLIDTHTGIAGVHPHWRNLDDEQLRAIADTGGTVGVIYQSTFLGDSILGGRCARIVDHLAHIVNVVGEDFASLGSDWDGMIVTPRDMPTCLELPRLVQRMLERRWKPERISKILGGNFLRALAVLRG